MSDMIDRLNAALEGRYSIDREVGEGGMAIAAASVRRPGDQVRGGWQGSTASRFVSPRPAVRRSR